MIAEGDFSRHHAPPPISPGEGRRPIKYSPMKATFTAADCERCRLDFPSLARTLDGRPLAFLDGPAGTQVPEAVIEAMSAYYRNANANTHGEFPTSRDTDRLLHETRETVAAFLGARSGREVAFGQNMTTLTFALSHGLVRSMAPGDEIVVTQIDHEANRGPWLGLQERGIVIREATRRSPGGSPRRWGPGSSSTPSTTPPIFPWTSRRWTRISSSARPTSSTAPTSASCTPGPASWRSCGWTGCGPRRRRRPGGSRWAPSTMPP